MDVPSSSATTLASDVRACDGLLDIRQKNDMLNALIFLVEYTGTALLS